jgi:hypothetical protein
MSSIDGRMRMLPAPRTDYRAFGFASNTWLMQDVRDVKDINFKQVNSKAATSSDVWARQLEERVQYAQSQISGAIEALDQILTAAIEQGSMMDYQVTEATEVLDIARDAVVQVARGIDDLAEAFMSVRDLLAMTRRSD